MYYLRQDLHCGYVGRDHTLSALVTFDQIGGKLRSFFQKMLARKKWRLDQTGRSISHKLQVPGSIPLNLSEMVPCRGAKSVGSLTSDGFEMRVLRCLASPRWLWWLWHVTAISSLNLFLPLLGKWMIGPEEASIFGAQLSPCVRCCHAEWWGRERREGFAIVGAKVQLYTRWTGWGAKVGGEFIAVSYWFSRLQVGLLDWKLI